MATIRNIVFFFLTIILIACSGSDATQPLKIGTNIWPGYEPLYLAREKGYFESSQVQLVEFTSSSQVIRAFKNNLLDAAALTLDETINLLASGEQLSIVLVTDVSNGGDALIAKAEIKTIEQLKQARIGVEHTALGAFFISRLIELTPLEKDDITIVPLEVNQHERAFREGVVDALVTFDPVRSRLVSSGGNTLFDSIQMPGEIVDVIVVKQEKIKSYQKHIKHMQKGWFMALDEMKNNPESSYKILAKRMKLDVNEMRASYELIKLPNNKQNTQMLYGEPVADLYPVSERLSQIMYENRLIKTKVDTRPLFQQMQVNN